MTTEKEDIQLNDCYQELFEQIVELQLKYNPQMVAGTMMAQALRIYKSCLTEDGYQAMVQTIMDNKDNIQPYEKPHIH